MAAKTARAIACGTARVMIVNTLTTTPIKVMPCQLGKPIYKPSNRCALNSLTSLVSLQLNLRSAERLTI